MSREEKIEILKRIIENFKSHIEEYEDLLLDVDLFRQLTYQLSIFERELKLLLLPQRTIDTLEVGDIVIVTNEVGRLAFLIETETQRYIYSKNKDWFNITDIIPHEVLELLKEILSE